MIKYVGKCLLISEKNEKGKEEKILVIGDLHIGYEEILNLQGVYVGRKMFDDVLNEIEMVFEEVMKKEKKIDKVILLGDVKHGFGKNLKQEWDDILELFDYFLDKKKVGKIIVCRGNHDNYLKNIAGKRQIEVVDWFKFGKYAFSHGDKKYLEMEDDKIKVWVLGHGHPAVKLRERNGVKVEKYKCYLVGKYIKKDVIIVPSFFGGNEGSDLREYDLGMAWDFDYEKFKVLIVEGIEVMDFGLLKNIN